MSTSPTAPKSKSANGHRTVVGQAANPVADREELVDQEEMEPKGTPHSDRYLAETAHAAETDDHTKPAKKLGK